jgi:protein NrfD
MSAARDPRALFGRSEAPSFPADYRGPTYYGRPALKASPWDSLVPGYMFVAGIAGSAQIIATLADLVGGPRARSVVRTGRMLALAGTLVGPPLLIADLKTPQRFYNMLRILRPTSPMSIGSWILSAFGLLSAATAAGEALRHRGKRSLPLRAARVIQVPAALAGAGMASYTASLLSATSTPLWAASPRLLAVRFACSSVATGAAALSLAEQRRGHEENARTLDAVTLTATAVEAVASVAEEREYRAKGVDGALRETGWGKAHTASLALGVALPIAGYAASRLLGRRGRGFSIAASLAVLAGGLLMRQATVFAGNESARRPGDHFALSRRHPR